jgi:outer membrane protein OmpA-like peptidoglycan-associated protein
VLEKFRVNFDYASAVLTDRFQSLLQSFVDDYPHKHKIIRVTGYTDSGTTPDGKIGNEWLALERAISVKKQLINSGYPETQILLEAKFLCCYIDSNESETGRYNNRRAELSLIQVLQH